MVLKGSAKKSFGQTGEIATMIAIGSLVVIGITSLVSSAFLGKKQTTKAKASGSVASLGCIQRANGNEYIFFKRSDASSVCDKNEIQEGPQNDAWLVGTGPCVDNNACGSGRWCYYFDNQYANSRCLTRDPSCDNGSCLGGGGVSSTPAPGGGAEGAGCLSVSANIEARPSDSNKGEPGVKAFYVWIYIDSNQGGDVKLELNGQHIAGWNGFAGGRYTYNPAWTQPYTHDREAAVAGLGKGASFNAKYTGWLSTCSPQQATINCRLNVAADGTAYVTGDGCNCSNCAAAPPSATNTPKPTSKPNPSTSTNTPTPKDTPTPTMRCDYAVWRDCFNDCVKGDESAGYTCQGSGHCWDCVLSTPTKRPISPPSPTPKPTNTPILTAAFCPNPNIPQLPSGVFSVGLYNEKGDGRSVDLASIINIFISNRVRATLATATTLNELRSTIVSAVTEGFLDGASTILSQISDEIDSAGLNYIKIQLGGFGANVPFLVSINGMLDTIAISSKIAGELGSMINTIANVFVDTIINNLCP